MSISDPSAASTTSHITFDAPATFVNGLQLMVSGARMALVHICCSVAP